MNEKKTGSMRRKGTISDTIVHVLLAVLAVIWVIPILWIVLLSFSSQKGSYVTTFSRKDIPFTTMRGCLRIHRTLISHRCLKTHLLLPASYA